MSVRPRVSGGGDALGWDLASSDASRSRSGGECGGGRDSPGGSSARPDSSASSGKRGAATAISAGSRWRLESISFSRRTPLPTSPLFDEELGDGCADAGKGGGSGGAARTRCSRCWQVGCCLLAHAAHGQSACGDA
eukprot:362543-Chlamydomonas_euryale.AAC.1